MDESYPKISIVTASYNQAKFLEEAIKSVVKQDYPNFEHIIFDNCSTDGTIDILKKYPHLIWTSEPDVGQVDALNKGFKKSTGEFIGWLNTDDLYLPNCFYSIAKSFKNYPDADIVYGDYRLIDQNGILIKFRRELPFDLFMFKYLHLTYIPTTTSFFRRKIFDDGNFLNVEYQYTMEYEFFFRLALRGYHFRHIPQIMSDFRLHADSKTSKQSLRQREDMEHALLIHDKFLQRFQGPTLTFVRNFLMLMARGKRFLLKLLYGAYFA